MPVEQIILGNGSNELIQLVIRTFLSVEEHAIQAFPTFLVYEKMVKSAGAKIISIPLSDFRIDLKRISDAITPETKIIFINNPNNPTGTLLLKEELSRFLNGIPDGIIVVLDEAYIEFALHKDAANGLELLSGNSLLIVLRTFSKLYGLAGLRIGYGFASKEIIDYMNRVRQPFNSNTLAQVAATAALDDSAFVSNTLKVVNQGLCYLCQALDENGLEYIPTQTNFLLIKMPQGGKKVYDEMLKQGVIVRLMDSFGLPDYIRINAGLPEENARFIKALKMVLGV